jgi:hypothetical protein
LIDNSGIEFLGRSALAGRFLFLLLAVGALLRLAGGVQQSPRPARETADDQMMRAEFWDRIQHGEDDSN